VFTLNTGRDIMYLKVEKREKTMNIKNENKNNWDPAEFDYFGGYLTYEASLVAKFKKDSPISVSKYKKFIMKNINKWIFFNELDSGKDPFQIIVDRGYKGEK